MPNAKFLWPDGLHLSSIISVFCLVRGVNKECGDQRPGQMERFSVLLMLWSLTRIWSICHRDLRPSIQAPAAVMWLVLIYTEIHII